MAMYGDLRGYMVMLTGSTGRNHERQHQPVVHNLVHKEAGRAVPNTCSPLVGRSECVGGP